MKVNNRAIKYANSIAAEDCRFCRILSLIFATHSRQNHPSYHPEKPLWGLDLKDSGPAKRALIQTAQQRGFFHTKGKIFWGVRTQCGKIKL